MHTHNIHFQDKIRDLLLSHMYIYIYICSYGKNIGTQEGIRNGHGRRAIGVRAIEVSVYSYIPYHNEGVVMAFSDTNKRTSTEPIIFSNLEIFL